MNEQKKDIPVSLALALLGVVVGGFFYLKYPNQISHLMDQLDHYGDTHLGFLALVLGSLCTNLIWGYTAFSERLGINQQGKRLEILTGRRRKPEPLQLGRIFKIGSAAFAVSFLAVTSPWLDPLPQFLPPACHRPLCIAVALNFGLCGGIAGSYFAKSTWRFSWRKRDELPPMPVVPNGIVLGTVGEDEDGLS